MRVLLVHLTALMDALLGGLPAEASPAVVEQAAKDAVERVTGRVEVLRAGFDRVLVATDPSGGSFRTALRHEHAETRRPWPPELWDAATVAGLALANRGAVLVPPPAFGSGHAFEGQCPSARDTISSVAWWWTWEGRGAAARGDCLRIASPRASLGVLVCDAAGIELTREVRGTWPVLREGDVREAGRVVVAPIASGRAHRVTVQPDRVADWGALRSLDGVGAVTAAALLDAHGTATGACQAAISAERLPRVTAPALASLRAAGAHGGREILRALAVASLRDDVEIDVGALLGAEVRSDGAGEARRTDQPSRIDGHPVERGGHRVERGAGPRGEMGSGAPGEPASLRGGGDLDDERRGGDRSLRGVAEGPGEPVAPPFDGFCMRCPAAHQPFETCGEARDREAAERVAELATIPREPPPHGAGVVVTSSNEAREAAHMMGADMVPPDGLDAAVAGALPAETPRNGAPDARRDHGRDAARMARDSAATTRETTPPQETPMPPDVQTTDTAARLFEPKVDAPLVPYVAPAPAQPAPRPAPLSLADAMMSVPPKLASALVDAQLAVGKVGKDSFNKFHQYNYAAGDDMIDAGRHALAVAGLALVSHWKIDTSSAFDREQEGKKGTKVISVIGRVVVSYTLIHRSGEAMRWITSTPIIPEAGRPDDKAECGALTTNLGYTMRHLLCISRGDEERERAPEAAGRDDRAFKPGGSGFAASDPNDRADAYRAALDAAKTIAAIETVEKAVAIESVPRLKADALKWIAAARAPLGGAS